jgi:hypothetical protein
MIDEILTAALVGSALATGIGALASSVARFVALKRRLQESERTLRGLDAFELAAAEDGWDEPTKLRMLKTALAESAESAQIARYSTDDWRKLAG